MMTPNPSVKTRIQFDQHQCQLPQVALDRMRESLDSLLRQAVHFPIADVHVLIEHNSRSNDYSVKVALILPGDRLVGHDHDQAVHAAFERCLVGLEQNLQAYKDRLDREPERQKQEKGTHQEVEPSPPPDPAAVEQAIEAGDYAAFRSATLGYEEPIRKRIGRWIERVPEVEVQIGKRLQLADIVEEVFLMAFDRYSSWPDEQLRFGEWLAELIDPAVKALWHHRDEELENINLVRSARVAEQGRESL
jgi:ribosome-associated translation inhibitor RaiA